MEEKWTRGCCSISIRLPASIIVPHPDKFRFFSHYFVNSRTNKRKNIVIPRSVWSSHFLDPHDCGKWYFEHPSTFVYNDDWSGWTLHFLQYRNKNPLVRWTFLNITSNPRPFYMIENQKELTPENCKNCIHEHAIGQHDEQRVDVGDVFPLQRESCAY